MHTIQNKSAYMNAEFISREEAAEIAQVCKHTIRNWEKAGLIKAARINSRIIRYRRADIIKLLEEGLN
jgi:DNA-binding transcriptional MerR regulator